jgi:hypothetical protein
VERELGEPWDFGGKDLEGRRTSLWERDRVSRVRGTSKIELDVPGRGNGGGGGILEKSIEE